MTGLQRYKTRTLMTCQPQVCFPDHYHGHGSSVALGFEAATRQPGSRVRDCDHSATAATLDFQGREQSKRTLVRGHSHSALPDECHLVCGVELFRKRVL
ncbi:hypothetical protein TNCV_3276251 [Trichonephila clavipes]|nr:hypothetical protein TNCV_3276251 [Trichonephila clavipes]